MTERKTCVFENGLIWFGAGVSLAEILTGVSPVSYTHLDVYKRQVM